MGHSVTAKKALNLKTAALGCLLPRSDFKAPWKTQLWRAENNAKHVLSLSFFSSAPQHINQQAIQESTPSYALFIKRDRPLIKPILLLKEFSCHISDQQTAGWHKDVFLVQIFQYEGVLPPM